MHSYESINEGSKGLLIEVVGLLNASDIDYVIIGGWCPVLRNKKIELHHPGTKDVDVLFKDGQIQKQLGSVINSFLNQGYIPSAKHDFQLLRVLEIKNRRFVYNVDLLHPSESRKNPELFVDHFEFDICENREFNTFKIAKSIVLPSSSIIFEGFYNLHQIDGFSPYGIKQSLSFPLIDESGLILSKCQSIKSIKRERDFYDIYVVLSRDNIEKTIGKLSRICEENEDVLFLLQDGMNFIKKEEIRLNQTVKKFLHIAEQNHNPSRIIINVLERICKTKD